MAKFFHFQRVTYADCTIGNHVYYARYLEMLEAARGEFFRQMGSCFGAWQGKGLIFPVVELRLKYAAPARYDDLLACEVWFTRAEGARLNFGYRVENQAAKLILEGESWHVCAGLDEKPARLPQELIALAKSHLRTAPGMASAASRMTA